jgi:ABC-type transport system substrate-binding protein
MPLTDHDERAQSLIEGRVDATHLGPAQANRVAASANCRVVEIPGLSVDFLWLNKAVPPLDDLRVRRAIDLALDRGALIREALGGHGALASQLVSRIAFGHDPDLAPSSRNLDQARRLLAEAGHAEGLELEIETYPSYLGLAEAVARQLGLAGVATTVTSMGVADVFDRTKSGEAVLALVGYHVSTGDAGELLEFLIQTPHPFAHTEPELTSLVGSSRTAMDLGERQRILQRCMRLLRAEAAFLPLVAPPTHIGLRKDLVWSRRLHGLLLARDLHFDADAP